MIEIDAGNVLAWLRGPGQRYLSHAGLVAADLDTAVATELAWGVSNIVIRVDAPRSGRSFVLKQSREKLRTQIDWFSRLERIWREVDMLHALRRLLPDGAVPVVLFEDRDSYLFAMEAIQADHRVWKAELLDGRFDLNVAANLAACLAAIHRGSAGDAVLAGQLGDRTVFDELRLDPFYRYVAAHDEHCRAALETLVETSLTRSDSLVLADFSPKNILLTSRGPVLVDFETGHFGDPAFDVGFFLSHLLLKAVFHTRQVSQALEVARVFERGYRGFLTRDPVPDWAVAGRDGSSGYERRCVQHLGACMLARVAGKSRVDYLKEDWQRELVTSCSRSLLTEPARPLCQVIDRLEAVLRERDPGSCS